MGLALHGMAPRDAAPIRALRPDGAGARSVHPSLAERRDPRINADARAASNEPFDYPPSGDDEDVRCRAECVLIKPTGVRVFPGTAPRHEQGRYLRGKTDGKPVTLAGYLLLPKAAPDVKQPAVILIHGSGGLGSSTGSNAEWQRELTNAGFAVFALDNFSGRGIVSTVADQSQLGRYNAIVDAYRALEVLAKHRNIDATKIAVMGFSRGGQSSTYANLERFWKSYGSPDLQFAAHINVYSNCGWSLQDDDKVLRPMPFLHGSADDWALPASCREYSARLANTGTNIRFVEYPDAHHAFDAPAFKTPVKVAAGQKWSDCRVGEEKGELVNKDTGQPFSFSDACVKKGTTVAYHEEAAKKSHEDVKNFLKEVFGAK